MTNIAKIKEFFVSIQGEGPYIGYNQLFIRFCDCNLRCKFCDTEFSDKSNFEEYTPQSLMQKIGQFDLSKIHSISLTGGEPLLHCDFLTEFLTLTDKKIYLETNGTLYEQLNKIKYLVDIISADIKLESATGIKNTFEMHEKFLKNCQGIETFGKIVFNKNITDEEIIKSAKLGKNFDIELILQPEMKNNQMTVNSDFIQEIYLKYLDNYDRVRIIPQVHKFLGVE